MSSCKNSSAKKCGKITLYHKKRITSCSSGANCIDEYIKQLSHISQPGFCIVICSVARVCIQSYFQAQVYVNQSPQINETVRSQKTSLSVDQILYKQPERQA